MSIFSINSQEITHPASCEPDLRRVVRRRVERDDLVAALQQLNDHLEIPRLGTLADRDQFERVSADMAEAALESGSPGFNPRVPDAAEIVALYRTAYAA